MMKSLLGASLGLGLVLLACSGGSGSTNGGGSGAPSENFATQYCDLFAPCCTKVNKTYNQGSCSAILIAIAGTRNFDAAKAQTCIDSARADSAKSTFCDEGISDATDDLCEEVFTEAANGTKKPGDPCESTNECAASTEGKVTCASFFSNNATTRICRLEAAAKENEDCVGTRDGSSLSTTGASSGAPQPRIAVCETSQGLFCNTMKKCARISGPGGPCESSLHSCDDNSYCDISTRMCVPRIAAGGDCTQGGSGRCVENHYCDDATKKCTVQIGAGQPCTMSTQCAAGSCTNGKCGGGVSSSDLSIVCQ